MKTDPETLLKLQKLHEEYIDVVQSSGIKPLTAKCYLEHANNFVRWVDDGFQPGGTRKKNKLT